MAEINIVRKPPMWPWVATALALLLVIGLVVWAVSDRDADQVEMARQAEGPTPLIPEAGPEGTAGMYGASPMQDYLRFAGVIGEGERPEPGLEHVYTAEGLDRLAAALRSVEVAHPGAMPDGAIAEVASAAERIRTDPRAETHANTVREAFIAAANAIDSMEPERAAQLREAARAVSPDQQLLEQIDEIQAFFERSAEAIQRAMRTA